MKVELSLKEWKERWDEYYASHDEYEVRCDIDLPFSTDDEIILTDNLCRHCKKPIKPYDTVFEVLDPDPETPDELERSIFLCDRCHQDYRITENRAKEIARAYVINKEMKFLNLEPFKEETNNED